MADGGQCDAAGDAVDAAQPGLFPPGLVAERHSYFQGPLPPAEELASYAAIDPSFAERIVLMAEKSLDAVIADNHAAAANDTRDSETAATAIKAGLGIVLLMTLLGLAIAIVLGLARVDYWWLSFSLPVLSTVPAIVSAATANKSKHRTSAQRANERG